MGLMKLINKLKMKSGEKSFKKKTDDHSPSHSPPKMKSQEMGGAYNPFFWDLSKENRPLDPSWMMPGIVVNWLMKTGDDGHNVSRLILGIEAMDVDTMANFLDVHSPGWRQWMGNNWKKTLESMLFMGHPSLACHIQSGTVKTSSTQQQFVEDNYDGVLGGELHYDNGVWSINYNSGRYGDQHIGGSGNEWAKGQAKLLFLIYTGTDVVAP